MSLLHAEQRDCGGHCIWADFWFHPASGEAHDVAASSLPSGNAPLPLRFALAHPDLFPGFAPPRDAGTHLTPGKHALRDLWQQGWVSCDYMRFEPFANDKPNIFPLKIKGVLSIQAASVVSQVAALLDLNPDAPVCVNTSDVGVLPRVTVAEYAKGRVRPDLTELWQTNQMLNGLLDEVRAKRFAHLALVGGSAVQGRRFPGDLDILVDLSRPEDDAAFFAASGSLLRMGNRASGRYGWFDPHVLRPGNVLLCRDDESRSWIPVRASTRATVIRAWKTEGVAVTGFAPLETGPAPAAKPSPRRRAGPVPTS